MPWVVRTPASASALGDTLPGFLASSSQEDTLLPQEVPLKWSCSSCHPYYLVSLGKCIHPCLFNNCFYAALSCPNSLLPSEFPSFCVHIRYQTLGVGQAPSHFSNPIRADQLSDSQLSTDPPGEQDGFFLAVTSNTLSDFLRTMPLG